MASLRKICDFLLRGTAGVWLVLTGAGAHADLATERADRLLYDEALYHIYNNDFFTALTLLENDHTGSNHIDNLYHNKNHLLAVQASLHLGMYSQAQEILEHLKFTNRDQVTKDLSLLYWGKLRYQQGQYQQAVDELLKISPKMPQDARDEANYYLAMSYIYLDRPEQATPVLAKMGETSLWTAYAYYNLAMKYAETDVDPSRALIALRVAGAMTNKSQEGLAINDRIQLTGGYLALREQDYGKAINFLQKVRVKGETAPSAIYAYGMAYTAMGQHRAAVQMWHRAKKYSLVIPGVAESFQSIAYGFEQENLRSSAIESYLEAVTVYEKELVQLDKLIQDVRKRGAMKALLEDAPQQDLEWFLLTDVVTNTPKVGFISYVMSDEAFHARSKTLLELRELQKSAAAGRDRLRVFQRMLQDKQRGYKHQASGALSKQKVASFNRVVSQRNALVKDLENAERSRDYLKFVPNEFTEQLARVESVERQLTGRSETDEMRRRAALLKGTLIWRSMNEFDANRQAMHDKMAALDEQINLFKDNLTRFQTRTGQGPEQYRDALNRIGSMHSRAESVDRKLEDFITQEDRTLTEMAVELLESHRKSMTRHKLESQMALVNLFDDMAIAQYSKKPTQAPASKEAM